MYNLVVSLVGVVHPLTSLDSTHDFGPGIPQTVVRLLIKCDGPRFVEVFGYVTMSVLQLII